MASPRRSILLDLRPLRASPPFARLYLGNLVAGVGSQMTIVAVSLEVFDQTQSTFAVGLYSALFLGLFTLPSLTPTQQTRVSGLRSILDGVRYLRQMPHVSAGFLLDIVAMTFGSPRVLMPAAGTVVLGGGAATSGLLLAAPAVTACSLGTPGWRAAAGTRPRAGRDGLRSERPRLRGRVR